MPQRRPGSVRRTSTIDSIRLDSILGDLTQIGRCRDIYTGSDGSTSVLGEATIDIQLDYVNGFKLKEIRSSPLLTMLNALLGSGVTTGFRRAMVQLVPDEYDAATPLHLLLDDLPGAALVSGFAIGVAGAFRGLKPDPSKPRLQIEGLCAGFQAGGTIMQEVDDGNYAPVVTGPEAPPLTSVHDGEAWHKMRPLGAHDCRRARLLDVFPGSSPDAPVHVEAYFRDSHMDTGGLETVIHEYSVTAVVDRREQRVVSSSAVAHTLPWIECIEAVDSGQRLAGHRLGDLRTQVREELVGTTTCTHLNDTLRSIQDVGALLALLNSIAARTTDANM